MNHQKIYKLEVTVHQFTENGRSIQTKYISNLNQKSIPEIHKEGNYLHIGFPNHGTEDYFKDFIKFEIKNPNYKIHMTHWEM